MIVSSLSPFAWEKTLNDAGCHASAASVRTRREAEQQWIRCWCLGKTIDDVTGGCPGLRQGPVTQAPGPAKPDGVRLTRLYHGKRIA